MHPVTSRVVTGLDRIAADPPSSLKNTRLGLLCNPASLCADLTPAPEAIDAVLPGSLATLFSPQHGFYAARQDNMVESGHDRHPRLGTVIYSLYGDIRRPTPEMLEGLDVLLVDLVDVGCRVYTFFTTLVYCLEECAAAGVAMWVLDRPNPLGRGEEGPILPPELKSFVGPHAMPLRHGLSMGELALLVKAELELEVELRVIAAQGWEGGDFTTTGLEWIMPSPNLPTLDSARVYPGQVMFEGLNLSEGRGTTRPFEICGGPGLDPWLAAEAIEPQALDGARLRPLFYEPTFHKFAGQTTGGWQIHVTQPEVFRPLRLSLALISAIAHTHPQAIALRPPPYEYEHDRRPLDLILGDAAAVDGLLAGAPAMELEQGWAQGLANWRARTRPHLLYPG